MKHLGTKRIETPRLILRPFTMADAPKMFENWASDEEVTRFLTWPAHTSMEITEHRIREWVKSYEDKSSYTWCMEYQEAGEAIGSISVVKIKEEAEAVELGYCIGRKFWHQGICSEALLAVMDFLFDEVGINRAEGRHDPRNPHSGQVMEKCGLQYEGTRIEADRNNSGICDTALYGLTRSQRNQAMQTGAEKKAEAAKPAGHRISGETIDYVGILSKLELSEEEKEQAKKDMGEMLDYMDMLNELDTEGVEPMSHTFPVHNVFREDVMEHGDDRDNMLRNAPEVKDGSYKVPKTVE